MRLRSTLMPRSLSQFGIRLDFVLAPGLSPAGRRQESLGGRADLHSERPSGREHDGADYRSFAHSVRTASGLGDRARQILYRSDLVGVSVLDAGFPEPEFWFEFDGHGVAVVRNLQRSLRRKHWGRVAFGFTAEKRMDGERKPQKSNTGLSCSGK